MKPTAVHAHLELLAVDPATNDLLAYLDRCRENQKRGAYVHHQIDVPAVVAVGDFLAPGQEWTGRPAAELLGALRGANPVAHRTARRSMGDRDHAPSCSDSPPGGGVSGNRPAERPLPAD